MEKLLDVIEIQGEKLNVYFDKNIFLENLKRQCYSPIDLYSHNFILQGWEYGNTGSGIFVELRPGMVDFISTREKLASTKRNKKIIDEINHLHPRLFLKVFFELINEKENTHLLRSFWTKIYDNFFDKKTLSDEEYKKNVEIIKDIYKPAEKIENIYRINLKNYNSRSEQITGIPALIDKNIIVVYNYQTMKEAKEIAKKELGVLVLVKEGKDKHCLDELFDDIKYINADEYRKEGDSIKGQKIKFVFDKKFYIYTHTILGENEEIPDGASVIISDLEYSGNFSTVFKNKKNIYFVKTTKLATIYNKLKDKNKVKVISKTTIKSVDDLIRPEDIENFKPFADMNPDLENNKIFNATYVTLVKLTLYDFVKMNATLINKIAKMFFKDYKENGQSDKPFVYTYETTLAINSNNYFFKKENDKNLERMNEFLRPLSPFIVSYLKDKKEGRDKILEELFEAFKEDVPIDRMEIKNEN